MKLLLYIDGKKADVMNLRFVFTSLYQKAALMKKAVEMLKLENEWRMRGRPWEIFLIQQSCMP